MTQKTHKQVQFGVLKRRGRPRLTFPALLIQPEETQKDKKTTAKNKPDQEIDMDFDIEDEEESR
jgi:hypothetical protein